MVPCDLHTVRNGNVLRGHHTQFMGRISILPHPHIFEIIVDRLINSISHHGETSFFALSLAPMVKHYMLRSSLYQHARASLLPRLAIIHSGKIPLSSWDLQFPCLIPNEISDQLPHSRFISYL